MDVVHKSFLVLISGASCSGKTTTVKRLCQEIPHSVAIHQDDFYLAVSAVPRKHGFYLWDDPRAINWTQLLKQLAVVSSSAYEFCPTCRENENQNRSDGQSYLDSAGGHEIHYIFAEGTQLLCNRQLWERAELKVFLTLDQASCQLRRGGRSDYIDPPGFFLEHVWPSYCSMERTVMNIPGVVFFSADSEVNTVYRRLREIVMSTTAAFKRKGNVQ